MALALCLALWFLSVIVSVQERFKYVNFRDKLKKCEKNIKRDAVLGN